MIVSVGKSREITRIRQEVAAGRHQSAIRRLQTLVAVDPTDEDAYRLLVQIHRSAGDLAGAGRWGFLTSDATPEEIDAFERQHPSPWVRLRLLRWSGDPAQVPNPVGRARLLALINLAEQAPPDATGVAGTQQPHIPATRRPLSMERLTAPDAADRPADGPDFFGGASLFDRAGEPGAAGQEPGAPATEAPLPPGPTVTPSKRQLRQARRRAERLRRRELRREVRASTFISLFMITVLITLGVLGSLGAVRTMRSIIERLASMIIS